MWNSQEHRKPEERHREDEQQELWQIPEWATLSQHIATAFRGPVNSCQCLWQQVKRAPNNFCTQHKHSQAASLGARPYVAFGAAAALRAVVRPLAPLTPVAGQTESDPPEGQKANGAISHFAARGATLPTWPDETEQKWKLEARWLLERAGRGQKALGQPELSQV